MQESLTAAIFRGVVVPATALAKARAGEGGRKQIRLGLFGLGSRRQWFTKLEISIGHNLCETLRVL